MAGWNPWHGCHKISEGCRHCYVYRMDAEHGRDSSRVYQTGEFTLPIQKNRKGDYKIPSGETVYTCFTSDFLLEDADSWRPQAWDMIRARQDLRFFFVTKRIARFRDCLPFDWGDGWEHVHICCTVENQQQAAYHLPKDAFTEHTYTPRRRPSPDGPPDLISCAASAHGDPRSAYLPHPHSPIPGTEAPGG